LAARYKKKTETRKEGEIRFGQSFAGQEKGKTLKQQKREKIGVKLDWLKNKGMGTRQKEPNAPHFVTGGLGTWSRQKNLEK